MSLNIPNDHLLCTFGIYWPNVWVWTDYSIEKGDIFSIVRLLIKLQIDNMLNKLTKRLGAEAAKSFWGSSHLLLANKETFALSLKNKLMIGKEKCQKNKINNFKSPQPGTLAMEAGLEEGKLECKQEIPGHPSDYKFCQDEHVH